MASFGAQPGGTGPFWHSPALFVADWEPPNHAPHALLCTKRASVAAVMKRQQTLEFIRFLHIAQGSLSELETQVLIAGRLNYLSDASICLNSLQQISSQLGGLIKHLKSRQNLNAP